MTTIILPYGVGTTVSDKRGELNKEFWESRFKAGDFCAAIRFNVHDGYKFDSNSPEIVDGKLFHTEIFDYYNTKHKFESGVPKAVFKVIEYIAPTEKFGFWGTKGTPGSLILQASNGRVFEAFDCQKLRRNEYKICLSNEAIKFIGKDWLGICLVGCSAIEAKTLLTLVDKHKKEEEMQRQRETREKAEKKRMEQQASEKRKLEELQAEEELNSIFSTYQILPCPTCKTKCRIPKGKGRIRITCPNCKNSFIGDS